MQIQEKQWRFRDYFLHEYVLLVFMGVFSSWLLASNLLLEVTPSFLFDLPFGSAFILLATIVIGLGLWYTEFVQRHRELLIFAISLLFCLLLSAGVYQSDYNYQLVSLCAVFVALTGSYFTDYRFVTILLTTAYVAMGIVHLALPDEVVGYPFWLYMVFVPVLMLAYYYVVSQSIFTYRRLVESERNLLLKSRELNAILDSLNAMVAYKDKENRLITVNKATVDFLGREKSEIVGASLGELLPPVMAKKDHEEDLMVIETGAKLLKVDEKIYSPVARKDVWLRKTKFPFFDENGEVIGIVSSAEDVTVQVLAEQLLRESEERFRMLFEKAPNGMGLISIPNNQFVKVNQALANIVGISEDKLVGTSPADISHPEDRYLTLPLYHEAIKNGKSEYSAEQRLRHVDGNDITCRLSAHIVRESDKPKFIICIFQDVTQEREHELQLKKYARQLEESNQNLQEFAYAASHDLREPLRTVVSYVQLLQRYLAIEQQSDDVKEFMGYIVDGSRRMEKQILSLLQYSRVGRDELNLEPVELNYSLELVQAMLYAQISETKAIITSDPLPTVMAVPSQMEAVLQNLISNSLKYQEPGKTPVIHVSCKQQDDKWLISVADNGIGIETDYLDKVFAVFRRLHSQDQYPGSGVGLAICRRIVQRHGGNIWAESGMGAGSVFHFTLAKECPADHKSAEQPADSVQFSHA